MKKISLLLAALAASTLCSAQTDTLRLKEVVVTGTRNAVDVRHLPMTVTVIGREALTEQHQTNVLPTVMQQVPGFAVTSRGMMGYGVSTGAAGGINLRGLSGGAGQMLVLIDGHPQYQGIYGHPISDSYQTLMADRVEVLRGPASVLYGSNAMGGVINIVTRGANQPWEKGYNHHSAQVNLGAGSWGTIQTEAAYDGQQGRFDITAAAQYGRSDNHRPRMGFEQFGGYMKLGYHLSPYWKAYVDANITHFNASYPGTVQKPMYDADQWITRGEVTAALENNYGWTSGALSVYSNFGRHKIDDGTSDPSQPTARYFRSKDALTGISWYQSARLFEGNRITVGFDYQNIHGNAYYTSKETGEVLDTPNKQSARSVRNEVAAYVDFRQDLLTWLTVDAGVRVDHHSVSGTEWIPQAGLVVRPVSTGEIKFLASKGYRNPTMRELYLYPPSNEDLSPERLWNYELSWRQRLGSLTYGANLYYINGDNMIMRTQAGNGWKNLNSGHIKNYGLELEATYAFDSHWSVNTNHSMLKMKESKVAAAPKYKGYLGGAFRSGRWSVLAGLQYLSGLGLDNNADGLTDLTEKDFCLLNASVNYALNRTVTLWLRGDNLLAQRYELMYGMPMPRATFMAGVNLTF